MLGHQTLSSQVLIDLQELLCVLECSIFILLKRPLIELGLEGEIGHNELVGFSRGAIEVIQDHDHVGVLAQGPLRYLLLKVLYHVVYLLRLR